MRKSARMHGFQDIDTATLSCRERTVAGTVGAAI
jgi:hypothetical protein